MEGHEMVLLYILSRSSLRDRIDQNNVGEWHHIPVIVLDGGPLLRGDDISGSRFKGKGIWQSVI